nr:hypothetical protein [Tanacetum cinerariifolium]
MHANQYASKRVVLIDDAAYIVHPLAGQGVNMGYGDVPLLSNVIVDGVVVGSDVGEDGLEDVNPFGGENPLLTKKAESEHIIWDIGDEEEEYPFVNEYLSFKENLSCLWKMNRVLFTTLTKRKRRMATKRRIRRALFELLQRILIGIDVVKNVNKNNASHAVLFEALALVMHRDSEKEMMSQCLENMTRMLMVTDSNGCHIKFDLTEGQIGFVLPTIVPPCDINYFTNLVSFDTYDQANAIQNDVKTTEISVAFALEVSGNGNYVRKLDQQEEVDGDSPWNQLSEFLNLFMSSQRSFCSFPSFKDCQNEKWAPLCRVLGNWNEQVCTLLADSLIQNHLGLGYLDKDIVLSDSLARALGIKSFGPKTLVKMLSSLCHTKDGLTTMGHKWLSFGLNELHLVSIQNTDAFKVGYDVMNTLRKTPFIPLLGGCYSSIEVGTIWMSLNGSWANLEAFTRLFFNLRIVNPAIFDGSITNNLTQMLSKVGVQWEDIISEVYKKAYILTNHGFVPPSEVEIHFGNDFGNHIDICRFISGIDVKWYEVDITYMMYPPAKVSSSGDCEKNCKYLLEVLEQIWMLRVESEDEENSRTGFSQVGEDDAGALDRNVNLVEYLEF